MTAQFIKRIIGAEKRGEEAWKVLFRIREIREQAGLTQEELSIKSGVSRATIWALERGENKVTTTKTLLHIANALGVQLDDLFLAQSAK